VGRAVSDPSNFFDASAWRYQFCFPLIAAAPPALAYRLANLYGAFQARSHVAAQAHTVQQMRTVFADADAAQLAGYAKECYQLASRDIVDAFKFKRYGQMTDLTRVLTAQGIEPLIEHVRMGNRALLTGAHFGRFWMAGLPIVARGLTVGALTRDRMDENRSGLTQAEFAYRKKKLQVISEVFKGPFVCLGDSMREYFSAAEGLIMAMIFDVPFVSTRSDRHYAEVDFLGFRARFPSGVARVAKSANALIFPYFMHEAEGRLSACFLPPIDPAERTANEVLQHLASELEARIRTDPGHWWLWDALPLFLSDAGT
jgi:lauroyl/myristoyl acyltransferase